MLTPYVTLPVDCDALDSATVVVRGSSTGHPLTAVSFDALTIQVFIPDGDPLDLAETLRRLAKNVETAYEQWEEEHFPPGSDSIPLEMYEGAQ